MIINSKTKFKSLNNSNLSNNLKNFINNNKKSYNINNKYLSMNTKESLINKTDIKILNLIIESKYITYLDNTNNKLWISKSQL